MRIVHVSPTDTGGGADRGALSLHRALRLNGNESRLLVIRKYGDDPSVEGPKAPLSRALTALRDRLDRVPLAAYRWTHQNWWTVAWVPDWTARRIAAAKPDVVHLHWASRGLNAISLLRSIPDVPVVWTLRDMWPLTGGCHYTGGCRRYTVGCGACPQLSSGSARDITSWQWKRKRQAWSRRRITFVAMSNWMADIAREAPLTAGQRVLSIPNGVNTDRFHPTDKAAAREVWGIPPGRKIILFGALQAQNDPRKGLSYLVDALRALATDGWDRNASVIVYGVDRLDIDTGMDIRCVGHLGDEVSLALLYSAADVMVMPSVEENMGKAGIEAMACGIPVVAFANTGQFDLVDHLVNGYLAENLSAADLAQGIRWCLERPDAGLGANARHKALTRFDIARVAERYADLYRQLLARPSGSGQSLLSVPRSPAEAAARRLAGARHS